MAQAWSYVGAGAVASGQSPTVTLPSGIVEGDVLVFFTNGSTNNATPPSGWIPLTVDPGINPRGTTYYKIAVSGEVNPVCTDGSNQSKTFILAYRTLNAIDAVAITATGTGTTATTNTMTTSGTDSLVITYIAVEDAVNGTISTPSGTTSRMNSPSSTGNIGYSVSDENKATAGITTARSSTLGNTIQWTAVSISFTFITTTYTYVGAGAVATGSNPTVTLPTYIQGDLLVLVAGSNSNTITITSPSGWTQVAVAAGNAAPHLTVWYKIASASESNVVLSISQTATKAVIVSYRGILALDVAGTVTSVTSAISASTSSVTTTTANDLVMSIYVTNRTAANFGPPGNTIPRVISNPVLNNLDGILICDEQQTAIGATSSRTAITEGISSSIDSVTIAFTLSPTSGFFFMMGM